MKKIVYTIGYEGAALADFVATLENARVETLIDVRALPASRRPGFSKTPLARALAEKGIEYLHLRGLGNPQKLGAADNTQPFARMFEDHMQSEAARKDLAVAIQTAREKTSCLLCYERKPEECHRHIVAEHLTAQTGQNVHNLFVEKGGAVQMEML